MRALLDLFLDLEMQIMGGEECKAVLYKFLISEVFW